MQGNYSIQYVFLRFWLFLLSDNSNPLLGFLHSHRSTSLLSSPVIMYFSSQPSASLTHFLSFFATMHNRRYMLSFLPFFFFFFLAFLIVDTERRKFWLWPVLFCVTNQNVLDIFLALAEKPRYQPHFLRLNFPSWFMSSTLFLCAEEGDISNNSLLSQGGKKANCLKSEGWM